jgi:arginine-tRNA-protein transferase
VAGRGDIRLYLTTEHDCAYLANRRARNLVTDPETNSPALYAALAPVGFRRSGDYLYRPHCPACSACRSLRIPVDEFQANRAMRRLLRLNRDLSFQQAFPECTDEYFRLYQRYLTSRHPGGGMDESGPEDFRTFLNSDWCRTRFYEAREHDQLLAVAITDELDDALSAVYTFFDPDRSRRGLGTWAILRQVETARAEGLRWLYLGYWIDGCRKMSYKTRFRPYELLGPDGVWRRSDSV